MRRQTLEYFQRTVPVSLQPLEVPLLLLELNRNKSCMLHGLWLHTWL